MNFLVCYAYKKSSVKSQTSLSINYKITQHIEIISRQLRAIFVDFKTIMLRMSQNPIWAVKKSFFQTSTRLCFWPVNFFLYIFWVFYAYKKSSVESKKSSTITYSINWHVKVFSWKLKVILFDFKKIMLRWRPFLGSKFLAFLRCLIFK